MDKQRIRLSLLIVLFLFTYGGVRAATSYRVGQQRSPKWEMVPYQLGPWRGADEKFDPIYGTDPADSSLLRVYRTADGPPVIAYVGFFGDLATIMEVHTPELCFPAQGWGTRSIADHSAGTFRGIHMPARMMVADKNGDRRLVMWWYNAGPRPFQTRIRYVYAMLMMSAFTGRTDGSMVRLETAIEGDGEAVAALRINEFRKILLPSLEKALPQ